MALTPVQGLKQMGGAVDGGHTPSPEDDLLLPYISRMLMEEEATADELSHQYPDGHPVLLRALQPYAQILSGASAAAAAGSGLDDDVWPCNDSAEHNTTLQLVAAAPCYSPDVDTLAAAVPSSGEHGCDDIILDSAFFLDGTARDAAAAEPNGCSLPPAERRCMHEASMAFLEGMEVANTFLPGGSETPRGGRGRKTRSDGDDDNDDEAENRSRKQVAAQPLPESEEETAAREMLYKLILSDDDDDDDHPCTDADVPALRVTNTETENPPRRRRRRRGAGAARPSVDLHAMLVRCAEAVAGGDRGRAADLLQQIRRHSSPTGDATQRLAHCFAMGLEARLAGAGSELYGSIRPEGASAAAVLKAYQLYTEACCFLPVQFLFSNAAICSAAAGSDKLHVVHYGLCYGFQWPDLLRMLAHREGGPPAVRLTGIDAPQAGFRPSRLAEETGRRLADIARRLGVPFTFRSIAARPEDVRAADLGLDAGEVLAVNSLFHFRKLMDESVIVERSNPRDRVLGAIRGMRPKVFVHVVNNASYGGAFFLTRFREALHNFAALFDMMEAVAARDDGRRLVVEREVFARRAVNAIACEGTDRVERAQSYRQWQARSERAGLRQLPLDAGLVEVIRRRMKKAHRFFVVNEDRGWLLQGWKGRVLYALSTWTVDDDTK
ncbi:hypothetical protein ACP4OV_025193 [Aristida adscensionis]